MRWFSAVTMRSISMTLRDRGRAALLLCRENLNGNNHRSGTRLEVPPRTRKWHRGPHESVSEEVPPGVSPRHDEQGVGDQWPRDQPDELLGVSQTTPGPPGGDLHKYAGDDQTYPEGHAHGSTWREQQSDDGRRVPANHRCAGQRSRRGAMSGLA